MTKIKICNAALAMLIDANPNRDITAKDLKKYISSASTTKGRDFRKWLLGNFLVNQITRIPK